MGQKITYANKADGITNPAPTNQKVVAADMNQIKVSVNGLYDTENVTYNQLESMMNNNTLFPGGGVFPGRMYKITDRGDRGIFVWGITTKKVSEEGFRLMLCPAKAVYEYNPSGSSVGVWRNYKGKYSFSGLAGGTFSPGNVLDNGTSWGVIHEVYSNYITFKKIVGSGFSVGDTFTEYDFHGGSATGVEALSSSNPFTPGESFTIWGAHVFVSVSGKAGFKVSDTTLSSDWSLIAKTTTEFDVYEEVLLNIGYDFANNFIFSQWDNNGRKVGVPLVFFYSQGATENPVDYTDWNQVSYGFLQRDIYSFFGIRNNCPPPDSSDVCSYSNIYTGALSGNDCEVIQNVRCNGNFDPDAPDAHAFGAIANNKCLGISDINQTGGIEGIPDHILYYAYHTDDESFYIFINCEVNPLTVGTHKLNCIQFEKVRLVEYCLLGNDLDAPVGPATISSGLDVVHPDFIPATSIASINAGVKAAGISVKTTDTHTEFVFNVAGNDITSGTLIVIGKYA